MIKNLSPSFGGAGKLNEKRGSRHVIRLETGVSSYGTLELAIRMSVTRPRKYRTTILGQSFGVQGRLELNLSS